MFSLGESSLSEFDVLVLIYGNICQDCWPQFWAW
uniref:Uncharacterized protein n=1 Tax=Moniliophthora roreri TaxID=221103 RepID=A0A0W0F5J1_MONRR